MVAKGVDVPMSTVILTHIRTSPNDLLFMHNGEQFIRGIFDFKGAD